MTCGGATGPRLIQRQYHVWTWADAGATEVYYIRAEPLWADAGQLPPARRVVVGVKMVVSWTADRGIDPVPRTGVRLDLSGGQIDQETVEAIPLFGVTFPQIAETAFLSPLITGEAIPPDTTVVSSPLLQWPRDRIEAAQTLVLYKHWGCRSCLDADCSPASSIRVLARKSEPWAGRVEVRTTTWIASD